MTDKQKKFTYGSLYAARELAMDKGTSDEKHDTFRQYIGINNNYLSGIDTSQITFESGHDYTKVLIIRVDGYLPNILNPSDPRYVPVRNIIIQQYWDLSTIHDTRDVDIAAIQADNSLSASIKSSRIELINLQSEYDVYILHAEFLGRLSAELSITEMDGVKTWISYGVFPTTYQAYLEQYPEMTDLQKEFTYGCLFAARELAMDKGSSDEKHNTFRKYKGIINNYLTGLYDPNNHLNESPDTTTTQIHVLSEINSIKATVYPVPLSISLLLIRVQLK